MKNFQTLIITPFCLPSPAMVNAAAKNGAIGILDLEYVNNRNVALDAIFKLGKYSEEDFGIKVDIYSPDLIREIISTPPPGLKFFVLPAKNIKNLYTLVKILQKQKYRIILETTCLKQAKKGEDLGIDGVIAKGNEAGGWVSNETAFILLQRFLADLTLPVWVQGGIGLHTASACYAAGASGVVLDSQLLLTRESPLPDQIKTRIALMDGSETDCTGNKLGELYRVYNKQNIHLIEKIQKEEEKLIESGLSDTNIKKWHKTLSDLAGWNSWEDNLLFLGQDTILASSLAHKFHTVGGVLKGLTEAIQQHSRLAGKQDLFRENSPIAEFHSTSFPIVQGPMSRVSDNANFAFEVAKNGALPFFALGLMVQEKLTNLLKDARHVLSGYPWGVGILGFAPQEIKDEQQKAILRYRPPFVIIAGGLPKQAQYFEDNGIISYIHVPSAPLLKMFLKSGGKRFIFEGRECGGHVGPLSSFILWETAIEVLLEHISKENDTESYKILFAGGIHDALSASMVGALAATLAQKGIQVGILIGTAYLFTKEAVKSMAISDNFQKKAIECKRTVLISSGPGHAVRCINSPYVDYFEGEKSKLQRQGKTGDEIRETLERMNLGRLQIATKGIKRNPHYMEEKGESKDKEYITIEETEQQKEGLYMIGQVAALQDKILSMRELHHNITVKSSERLQNLHINQKNSTKNIQGKSEPVDIAIIGMACIFPKSPDLQTYWHNITEKVSAIEEIPQKRWDWKLYYDPDYKTKDKINSKWGGFIPDITFDPSEYGIPPNTLDYIEPLQLLVLKSVHSALADSGYLTRPFNRKRAAVVIGAGGGEADLAQLYSFRSALPYFFGESSGEILSELGTAVPQWTGDSFPGVLMNVAAGRIANRFDLGGSNYSVDAACASSLAALRAGILELKVKEADMVIVGGADTLMSPYVYTCFSKTGTLSPSGKCHPFDEKADGIVLAEGVAAIIIKRLQDAVRDGDRIYAVIKGISSSSDGKAKGLVAPRPEGQVLVLQRAYENADIDPETIGLIEAHGTGTTAGDKTESFSLNKFFSETPMLPKSCALGSVKSVIGHTKCAAGIAGLIKTVLALYNRVLPPTLGVETPNSEINKPLSPLYVNTETRPWINNNHPRRAGVSAFGFGGTNFHTVLEEYIDPFQERNSLYTINQWPSEVFIFKGESKPDIIKAMENLQKALKNGAKPSLKDLAFSLTSIDKKVPTYCLAVVADSLDDLNKKLITAKADLADAEKKEIWTGDGIYYKETSDAKRGRLAFLYPGQGSQYVGMLNDLSVNFDQVREVFEEFDGFLNEILPLPLSRYIYPPPSFSQEERKEVDRELIRTNIAQASMGAADLAVHKLLVRLGVKPDMVAGHSYGEYVALHAAGVFSKEALALLSEARGRFILEAAGSEPGTMAAVKAGEDEVKNVIGNIDNVWIANLNSPLQTVITGTNISVEKAMERLKEEGITSVPVAVACAFHSPIVSGAQQKLQKFIRSFDFKKPVIPVFSNVTAAPYPEGKEAVYDLLVRQLVSPVRFVEEIEAIYDAGARIFIEVGAGNILSKLIDRILSKKPHTTIYTDRKGSSALVQLQHTVAQLAASGVEMDMEPLYRYRQCKKLRLESLALDTNHKEASKTICLLNGSGIQPLDKNSRENFSPRPICFADSAEYRKETHEGMPLTDVKNNYIEDIFEEKMEQFTAKEKPSNEFQSPSDEKVIIQFQKLMSQFLDTQKNVMLAYLQGQTVSPPVLSGENMERKSVVSDSATISPRKEESITREELAKSATINFNPNLQAETFPSSASDRKAMPPVSEEVSTKERETDNLYDIESRFLSIVSERTGYPAEMLDLDLNLEADLGIDSIKKIEIIGTFKDEIAKSGIDSVNPEMESLSKSTTLRDIISQLKSSAGEVIPDKKTEAKCIAPEDEVILNHKEISERLLAIVEERTGYPLEMLNIDLDMEADLGIDSIKKIEILGHLRQVLEEKMGDSFDLDMEQASKIKTLGGMINWLSKEAGSDLPETELNQSRTADNKASHQDKKDAPGEAVALPEIKRYVLDTKEIPLDSLSVPLPPEFPVIVTGDKKNKVTNYVLEKLRTLNYKTVSIFHGKNYQKSELDCYNADLTSFDQLSTVVGEIKKDHGNISGLIHLIPLSHGKQMDNIMLPEWKKRLALEVKSLFYLTKLLAGDLTIAAKNGGGGIAAVTAMGGTFASTRNSSQMKGFFPGSGAVSGFIKAFAEECPGLNIRAIDINPDESLKIIGDQIILEFTTPANDVEVGYQSSKRLMLEIQERSLNSVDKINLTMDSSWVLLITGGARGITSTVACELAKLYKPIIILAGRMPLSERGEKDETKGVYNPKELKSILASILKNEKTKVKPIDIEQAYLKLTRQREIRSNIEKMQELGAKVRYFSVDVQDEKDFGVFIDKIYEEYGRIDGVIHGAGIIEDKLVKDKDINSFDRVFDTKADSLFILSKKIRPDMLRFFALFSSVAGRFGNSGQADYGAANEIYNKTALFLNNIWRARVVSYIWGPWESMGMVSDEVQKKFIEKGVYLIPRNLGPDLFVQELLYGKKPDVEVVFGGKNEEAKTLLPSIKEAGLPLLSVNSNFNPGHNGNIDIIRRFDEDKDIYLGDHRLDGYSVVPMAMILELMAEVVTHGLPELNLKAIKDLKVLKGIILKNGQEDIRIIATPAFRSGEKTTVNVQVKGTGDKETIYYNANAELTKEDGYGFPHSSLTINDAEPFPTPIKEAYQKWLFHGPIWHGIKKIGKIGRDGITATLRSSKPDNCLEGVPKNIPWVIDPVIIDSGLQLLILWMRANLGITPLPARFKNYFRFSAEPLKGDIQCEVRIYSNNGKGVVTANLFFILPDGNLFGMIEEIEIIGSKNLNRLTE